MKFSFTTFFAIQPMPAARPVRVAASMIVFTSLLSDMVILKNIFSIRIVGVEMISQAVLQHPLGEFVPNQAYQNDSGNFDVNHMFMKFNPYF